MMLTETERRDIAARKARGALGLHKPHLRPDGRTVCEWDLRCWPCREAQNAQQTLLVAL